MKIASLVINCLLVSSFLIGCASPSGWMMETTNSYEIAKGSYQGLIDAEKLQSGVPSNSGIPGYEAILVIAQGNIRNIDSSMGSKKLTRDQIAELKRLRDLFVGLEQVVSEKLLTLTPEN
jgi:hypothetical protein